MKKNISKKNNLTEAIIIDRFFSKLNFNKPETFNFKNDAAFLNVPNNKTCIVTNDTILESTDFFKNDSAYGYFTHSYNDYLDQNIVSQIFNK